MSKEGEIFVQVVPNKKSAPDTSATDQSKK
jgi:hypothetical protein